MKRRDMIFGGVALTAIAAAVYSESTKPKPENRIQAYDEYTIFGSVRCPWCVDLEQTMKDNNIPYLFVEVSQSEYALKLFREQGFESIPQVYDTDGSYIGGYSEAMATLIINHNIEI